MTSARGRGGAIIRTRAAGGRPREVVKVQVLELQRRGRVASAHMGGHVESGLVLRVGGCYVRVRAVGLVDVDGERDVVQLGVADGHVRDQAYDPC